MFTRQVLLLGAANAITVTEDVETTATYPSNAAAWTACDASRGGVVDGNEFKKCASKLGLSSCAVTRALKKYGTWLSTKAKFNAAYAYAQQENTCGLTWQKAWTACDYSKGGIVSYSELRKCLAAFKISKCEQTTIYIEARKRYPGGMYKSQFKKMFAWVKANKFTNCNNKTAPAPVSAWKVCDASKGGVVDGSEFRKCGPKLGLKSCAVNGAIKKYGSWLSTHKKFYTALAYAKSLNATNCGASNSTGSHNLTAASAWTACDASRGGIVDNTEFRNCLAKLKLPACQQKEIFAWAKKRYGSGMYRSQFNKMFAWASKHKFSCQVSSAHAWKVCDASRGGLVDPTELKNCLPKLGFSANATAAATTYCKKLSRCWLNKANFAKVLAYAKSK